jgi:hypothetical protein
MPSSALCQSICSDNPRSRPTRACWPPSRWSAAATAQVMDLTLVTSDDLLLGLGTMRTMKN